MEYFYPIRAHGFIAVRKSSPHNIFTIGSTESEVLDELIAFLGINFVDKYNVIPASLGVLKAGLSYMPYRLAGCYDCQMIACTPEEFEIAKELYNV